MWNNTKKISATTKLTVTPLITAEANLIRKRINLFDLKQSLYMETFRKLPLYKLVEILWLVNWIAIFLLLVKSFVTAILNNKLKALKYNTILKYKTLNIFCKQRKSIFATWKLQHEHLHYISVSIMSIWSNILP